VVSLTHAPLTRLRENDRFTVSVSSQKTKGVQIRAFSMANCAKRPLPRSQLTPRAPQSQHKEIDYHHHQH
jgi:hypothetical protein